MRFVALETPLTFWLYGQVISFQPQSGKSKAYSVVFLSLSSNYYCFYIKLVSDINQLRQIYFCPELYFRHRHHHSSIFPHPKCRMSSASVEFVSSNNINKSKIFFSSTSLLHHPFVPYNCSSTTSDINGIRRLIRKIVVLGNSFHCYLSSSLLFFFLLHTSWNNICVEKNMPVSETFNWIIKVLHKLSKNLGFG